MRIPSPSRISYGYLFLLISCLFSSLLNAADLRKQKEPKGPLGFRLDFRLATRGSTPGRIVDSRMTVFSTHLTFKQPVSSITNGQLVKMIIDAVREMRADGEQYGYGNGKLPGAVSFLAFGHEVILSTSQKGPFSFAYSYGASPVQKSLEACSAVWQERTGQADTRHFRDASCGEIMCAHQYYQRENPAPLKDMRARALTVSFTLVKDEDGRKTKPEVKSIPECGTNNNADWGCNLFVEENRIEYLPLDTKPEAYDLSTLAGGNPQIDQINMC